MLYNTLKCKLAGDVMILQNGVRRFLSRNYNIYGEYFALVCVNYLGSYELLKVFRATPDNTLEDEL